MINVQDEENRKIKAILVYDIEDEIENHHSNELEGLADTLGLETVYSFYVRNKNPKPALVLGTGKAQEIVSLTEELDADCIIFDFQISPRQQRNWEHLANIPVYDREEIILRIFASRAQTKEAVLQVELARLQYSLPRLAHSYGDMARQRGGNYGSKGSGETQLELDRRTILQKIALIKAQLEKVAQERQVQGQRRDKFGAFRCAIVGYTNAGKSSLLNALTGATAYTEDALFATLDTTTRKLNVNGATEILLSDTVGFIRNLPHSLVKSFRSTLEHAASADLIILLLDASDMHFESQYQTTLSVLEEIGAGDTQKIIAFNKIDAVEDSFTKNRIDGYCKDEGAIKLSAKTGEGFEELKNAIFTALLGEAKTFTIPLEKSSVENIIRQNGLILSSDWQDDVVVIKAHLRENVATALAEFQSELIQ